MYIHVQLHCICMCIQGMTCFKEMDYETCSPQLHVLHHCWYRGSNSCNSVSPLVLNIVFPLLSRRHTSMFNCVGEWHLDLANTCIYCDMSCGQRNSSVAVYRWLIMPIFLCYVYIHVYPLLEDRWSHCKRGGSRGNSKPIHLSIHYMHICTCVYT